MPGSCLYIRAVHAVLILLCREVPETSDTSAAPGAAGHPVSTPDYIPGQTRPRGALQPYAMRPRQAEATRVPRYIPYAAAQPCMQMLTPGSLYQTPAL